MTWSTDMAEARLLHPAVRVPHRAASVVRAVAGWLFLVAVAVSPLIYGGAVPLAWGLNALAMGPLLVAIAAARFDAGERGGLRWAHWRWLACAGALVLGFVVLQAARWTPAVLHHPAWTMASLALREAVRGAISVDPDRTLLAGLRLATTFAVFACALQLGTDRVWARRILVAVAAAGAMHAIAALAGLGVGVRTPPGVAPAGAASPQGLTGFFVNRNHFAIAMGLGLIAAWGLLLARLHEAVRDQGLSGRRELIARLLQAAQACMVHGLAIVPMACALLLTTSRAGITLTLAALVAMTGLERSSARRARSAVLAVIVLAAGTIAVVGAYGELLERRIAGGSVASDVAPRIAVAAVTIAAIRDRPVLGHGYGTFPAVFAAYRDGSVAPSGRWEEAHNVYLETLLELGVPVGLVLIAMTLTVALRCMRGAMSRRRDNHFAGAGAAALLLVGLHALVDFSVQLQGIALTVAALAGVGFAQSWRTAGGRAAACGDADAA